MLAEHVAEHCVGFVDQDVDVHGAGLERLPAGEGEQAPRQAGAALRSLNDQGGRLGHRRLRFEVSVQQVGVADDDGQDVVEVVRYAAGQLADSLELLRLEQLFACLADGLLRLFERDCGVVLQRNVSADVGKADQAAIMVPDGGENGVRPVRFTVRAPPPAFIFEATVLNGRGQRLTGSWLARSSSVKSSSNERPMTSSPANPVMRSAPGDQLAMAPSASSSSTAWSESASISTRSVNSLNSGLVANPCR